MPSNNARRERKSGKKRRKKRNIQSLVWLKSSIFVTLYSAYEAYERKKRERTKDDIALNPAIIRICVFLCFFFFFVFFKEQDNSGNSAIFWNT